jgi:hypothetical protein
MKLAKLLQFSILSSSVLLTFLLSNTGQSKAQEVVKMRFVWDFVVSGGAAYLNICDDPKFNINESTGGCADINVLNSNVTTNRARTRLVSDRLKSGQEYKVCIIADNTFSNRKGRWIDCIDFVATNGRTINLTLSKNSARYVGQP